MQVGRKFGTFRDASKSNEKFTFIYVDLNATGDGSGSSWANACTDMQTALNMCSVDAPEGYPYKVMVAPGTYYIQNTLKPYKDTTICGSGRDLTIFDGRNSVRGFEGYTNRASNVNYEHLTIQNCTTQVQLIPNEQYTKNGAAIFGWGNGYWGQNQINSSNAGSRTGGYVYNCRFYNTRATNASNYSAAGCINSFKWAVNCIFDNVYCFNTPINVLNMVGCIIKNQTVPHNCFNYSTGCKNNSVPDENDSIAINCTFFNGKPIENNTLLANPFMVNCLFYNNGTYKITNDNSNIPFVNCISQSGVTFSSSTNPKPDVVSNVGTVSGTDCHLASGSPCIGTGSLNFWNRLDNCPVDWTIDLDMNTRIRNGIIDIGAYAYV